MRTDNSVVNRVISDFREKFQKYVGKPLLEGILLRDLSNFRIGGPADYFFEARTAADLRAAVRAARESGLPHYVMGGGFNLLFDDAGFRGLLIKIALRGMELLWEETGAGVIAGAVAGAVPGAEAGIDSSAGVGPEGGRIRAAAGEPIGDIVEFSAARGFEGFEFLAGIPGTVGGAVFGNAGAFGRAIGDFLEEALLLGADGAEFRVGRDFFEFGYRHSKLKARHDLLLEAVFGLKPGNREAIQSKISEYLALREGKHPPPETAYAGSFFKNPVGPDGTKTAAGYLLEQAGARGRRVGGAAVSACHCNFLVNENNATARDVLALAAELKARVRAHFGIDLEEEVIFLPAAGPC
jgi:UDP-N-acetylmuramate dehydrogenase